MTDQEFENSRREAADEAYEDFDFGLRVEASNGWEYDNQSDEWTRIVFFENEDEPGGDTVKGTFNVHFDPGTSRVGQAYANVQGEIIESRPRAAHAP